MESFTEVLLKAETEGFRGAILDNLLAAGFHRACHRMYRTHINDLGPGELFQLTTPVFKVRYELERYEDGARARKILKRGSFLSVSLHPGAEDEESEDLYRRYLASIKFDTAASSREYLHEQYIPDPFDTWMLKVRDKGKLIAVGYFDKGAEAVMGVLNFFDPAYHSYSPGKFLILHMIHHARASGMKYFYPGSIQVYDDKMDYKMFTGKASIATFLPVEEEWRAYAEWDKQRMEMYFRTHRNRFEE